MPEPFKPQPQGDLLMGAARIAGYLGVGKGIARRLIRKKLIPTFTLDDTACARKSTITRALDAIEAAATQSGKGDR